MTTLQRHALGLVLMLCACDALDPTVPYPMHLDLEVVGDVQRFGLASEPLATPVTVRLVHAGTRAPVPALRLIWRTEGDAVIESVPSVTDEKGISQARVRFGSTGKSVLQVSLERSAAISTSIELNITDRPLISGVSVQQAGAGETIVLLGEFPPHGSADYEVLFDGVSAQVLSATKDHLRVVVPRCLGNRAVDVQAFAHGVPGPAVRLNVTEPEITARRLVTGEVQEMDGQGLRCVRLRERGTYLLVAQNARAVAEPGLDFLLQWFPAQGVATTGAARPPRSAPSRVTDWEIALRRHEAAALSSGWRPTPRVNARPAVDRVSLGSRRVFQVPTRDFRGTTVQARVRAIGEHVLIYEDLVAPAPLSESDVAGMANLFDRVIMPADAELFGAVPDVDDNGRVIILLSPAVNRLTEGDGSAGIIAGFAHSCDLIESLLCTTHNSADMLYGVVPDSGSVFGPRLSKERVLDLLPSVFAHELVHLIHFNQRLLLGGAATLEDVWLSEGLAHAAEDLVADRLALSGDEAGAVRMRVENYKRAARFLRNPTATGLVSGAGESLPERGASWLFVKYLTAQFGNHVLPDLLQSLSNGVETVTTVTGRAWPSLLSGWSVALFSSAVSASEIPTDARYRLGSFDLGAAVRSVSSGAEALISPFRNSGALIGTLPSSGVQLMILEVSEPANVVFAGTRGRTFAASAAAQLAVLRIR